MTGPAEETYVTVRYFAAARAAAGVEEEKLAVTLGSRVRDLADDLGRRYGADLERVLAASSFLVDEVAAGRERQLPPGAVVDVLPPFAGG